MLKKGVYQLLNENESAYSLVVAIAKRSREISDEALKKHIILDEKPVSLAVDEFAGHKYKVVDAEIKPEIYKD